MSDITKKQVSEATDIIMKYCNMFEQDNQNREHLMESGRLPSTSDNMLSAKSQLANHYAQKQFILAINSHARKISEFLNSVTYHIETIRISSRKSRN